MNHPSTSNESPANGAPTPMMAPYGAAPSMLASAVANQPNSGGGAVSLSLPAAPPVGFSMPACAAAYAQPWPYSASIVTPVPVPVPVSGGPAPRLRKACDLCHENRLKCVMTPTGKCEQCTARGFECKRCATAQPPTRPERVRDPALTLPVPCVLSQAAGWRRSAAGHGWQLRPSHRFSSAAQLPAHTRISLLLWCVCVAVRMPSKRLMPKQLATLIASLVSRSLRAGKWHRWGCCRRRCRSCIRAADAPAPDACVRRFSHGRLRAAWRAKAGSTAARGLGIRSHDSPSAALAPVAASDGALSKSARLPTLTSFVPQSAARGLA